MDDDDKGFSIPPDDFVTVTLMNDIYEIQYLQKSNRYNNILKIDSDRYVVKSTGELKYYEHTETRSQSINSIKQTMKKLRYLINANFSGQTNELWSTLTFRDSNIAKRPQEIYKEFNKFIKRLNYKYKEKLDYIAILEPHGINSSVISDWHGFHLHLLLKSSSSSLYIPYQEFEEIWGLGMCRIERLKNIDNIGAYLSAYLTNAELSDTDSMEKKYIKGSRLWLYPKGVRIYRKSKGIQYPKRIKMPYQSARDMIGIEPHYTKTYKIENDNFENIVIFEQFNKKRR
ncbi:TPA: replicative protein [Streptococcus suis]|nr:replicative protein [Streptococcus suis]HEM4776733.1 replicative protein [Streptococcus suis]HEM4794674.1 replicative protein [Streptococcus suis]HEM4895051.1 replicative protein [Streptococcus suis]HEM4913254.1 replicative protein [Streptococcus suis]